LAPVPKLVAPGALALIIHIVRHGDVAATYAQEPLSFSPANHGFELVAFGAVGASDDGRHSSLLPAFDVIDKSGSMSN
jgi:hypothetical protein